jgi:AcrR family transcriptional regulator
MQAIADRAGLAKGTLYLYFKDRDELVESSADVVFSELLARLEAVLSEPRPLADALRALIATKLEFFDRHHDFLRVYVAARGADPHTARQRRAKRPQYARYVARLTQLLAAATARGELKAVDPARVALFLVEGVSAILLQRLTETPPPAEHDTRWIVELLLHGLAAPGKRP